MNPSPPADTVPTRPSRRGVRVPAHLAGRWRAVRAVAVLVLACGLLASSWAGAHASLDPSGGAVAPAASAAPAKTRTPGSAARLPHLREDGTAQATSPADLPDGWGHVTSTGYSIALPSGWLVVDRKTAGNDLRRAQLAAAWPFDAQVIEALSIRVTHEKLSLVAVEMPWRAGTTTVTVRSLPGPLGLASVVRAVDAAGAHEARPMLGSGVIAFRFDTTAGFGADARAVSTALLPFGASRHLVVEVSAPATETTTADAIADRIVETFRAP